MCVCVCVCLSLSLSFSLSRRSYEAGGIVNLEMLTVASGSSLVKAVSDREDEVLMTEVSLVQDDDRKVYI